MKPMGPIPPFFDAHSDALRIAGQTAESLVNLAGGSPAFIYDFGIVRQRIAGLRAALPPEIGISYAVKANPYAPLVQAMSPLVEGMDVASSGELALVLAAGVTDISFAGPGKRDADLRAAILADAVINLESVGEAQRALAIAQQMGRRPRLAVRINPDFGLKGSGLQMAGGAQPFGVDVDRVPALVRGLLDAGADWQGFHLFAGSQSLIATAIADMHGAALVLCGALAAAVGVRPNRVTIGAGFGVPYAAGEKDLDLMPIGNALDKALRQRPAGLQGSQIVLEMGRYLVAECGVYLTRILDRKLSHDRLFLVVDGGLHHQLAAAGLFGSVVRRNFPLALASQFAAADAETATIVGCLCTPLDRLADQVRLPRAEIGDLVAVFLAGAYGATASPSAFLGHGPAREVLIG
jgi:diaminopimelate decarboxylase